MIRYTNKGTKEIVNKINRSKLKMIEINLKFYSLI